jgi:hypothetical protein
VDRFDVIVIGMGPGGWHDCRSRLDPSSPERGSVGVNVGAQDESDCNKLLGAAPLGSAGNERRESGSRHARRRALTAGTVAPGFAGRADTLSVRRTPIQSRWLRVSVMSSGVTKESSRARSAASSDQDPLTCRTAIAAVGNFACMRSSAAAGSGLPARRPSALRPRARARASAGSAGSWPTTKAVLAAGGSWRISSSRPFADVSYTWRSNVTCGRAPSSASASCHVSRARRAVEHRTWSGTQPAWRSQRPAAGASRRPRRPSGRS